MEDRKWKDTAVRFINRLTEKKELIEKCFADALKPIPDKYAKVVINEYGRLLAEAKAKAEAEERAYKEMQAEMEAKNG
jgi:hypothetical protein